MRRAALSLLLAIGLPAPLALGQGDPETLSRIVDEATNNSQVWETMRQLSEEHGPRLTGSTNEAAAQAWARDTFVSYGLANAHLAKWGEIPVRFDRGHSTARMVEPQERDFEFTARSWSAGTVGPVRGTMESQIGAGALRRVRYDAATKTITFGYVSEMMGGTRLRFRATLEGDALNGSIDFEGEFSMPFTARRAATADVAAVTAAESKVLTDDDQGDDGDQ